VDSELEEQLSHIDEETVHVPLKLAQNCIRAIKDDRRLIPTVLDELRQILDFRSTSEDSGEDEPQASKSYGLGRSDLSNLARGQQQAEEEEEEQDDDLGSLSGENRLPDLGEIDLDDEEFIKEQEQRDDLELDSDPGIA
jgi:hypothetical protein